MRAQRQSPEDREDGGGGGSPSPPSRGVTLARPPAALGGREGGRNASLQALISPPSPVPGTRGQRPPGRGPGSGFGAAHAGVRGRVQRLPPVLRQAGPCFALGLSFLHGGVRTWSGPEQSKLPLGRRLGPSCWDNLYIPSLSAAGSLVATGPSAPSAVPLKKWIDASEKAPHLHFLSCFFLLMLNPDSRFVWASLAQLSGGKP